MNRLANIVTRTWTDADRDFVADCDLTNVLAQDLRASGGDFCGVVSDTNFGKPTLSLNYDPETLNGWGTRPFQWEFSTSVQHQIVPRVSVDVGYFRRWYGNFGVTDNLTLGPSDFGTFGIDDSRGSRGCRTAAARSPASRTSTRTRRRWRRTTTSRWPGTTASRSSTGTAWT